jgi:hypothetical protein
MAPRSRESADDLISRRSTPVKILLFSNLVSEDGYRTEDAVSTQLDVVGKGSLDVGSKRENCNTTFVRYQPLYNNFVTVVRSSIGF